ncbi:MAG: hypothetical protein COV32_01930 [Candidatus Yonathbacteria bacterium CG10_big_fil_rev_8_21_14_0_10_43_136]|uniref:GIY-YIG domain-containing protein n=2 Tax=Parcubacteria group TaxID=1794811 RepID=A0A2M7Q532_9BACT|nr:MAG: hypothetical protein AUK15_01985 [Candidatus Nomurabacteria bacterium CG2_30_43_9]PIR40713.1 MAG: hypothetical protein COV32_01930 [Candidatus Yonathbacteria bacterium CG10_big_fil_rev_8_21_14_0_10_43_136]PIY58528.1 MAG: hypothetical protein COY98_01615 [Candidatus Yonathbacteria bacterium CG_4_10_14_0_8_um_filter_43_17]PJC21558.1 MAG: hypothetical protein CO060_03480 [Candidatus Yonathbacteria bacterium CG_4_9_14_0_2_um_filter_43_16]
MQPVWQKYQGNKWVSLMSVDLAQTYFDNMEGVYVIWQGGGPVVRVGQGIIRDRLSSHRRDTAVTAYPNLYVTWASISATHRDGVERYLANALAPRVGDAFPDVNPIQVTLPF